MSSIWFEVDVSREPFTSNARFYAAQAPDVVKQTKTEVNTIPPLKALGRPRDRWSQKKSFQ